MKTIIVWYRNDLRIHDHPALAKAVDEADYVIPIFIFNTALLHGRHGGSNRNRFLLESLQDLKRSLRAIGGDLVIRTGNPAEQLLRIVEQADATAVFYTSDFTSYAIGRDRNVEAALQKKGVECRGFAGRLIVSAISKLHTKAGTTHKVFTPFWKNWMTIGRREVAPTPTSLMLPTSIEVGELPVLPDLVDETDLSPDTLPGGEAEGRQRLEAFLGGDIATYHQVNNDMAADNTSRLSAYFHFGCISALEAESMLPDNEGARAWNRQLAWRDFYHYILFHFPDNATKEYQKKYRNLQWGSNRKLLQAWQEGKTGYPIVDAAMRQLLQEGWMHNRARLIVGSFLTKDLWLDWRFGESHFMHFLIDGDQANNNGNWQWIASVGVDPAPVYRRLYNPTSQAKKFDPTGAYIRRYVPELKHVSDKYLSEPWTMSDSEQADAHCRIGQVYPAPIVDHKLARVAALEHYRQAA